MNPKEDRRQRQGRRQQRLRRRRPRLELHRRHGRQGRPLRHVRGDARVRARATVARPRAAHRRSTTPRAATRSTPTYRETAQRAIQKQRHELSRRDRRRACRSSPLLQAGGRARHADAGARARVDAVDAAVDAGATDLSRARVAGRSTPETVHRATDSSRSRASSSTDSIPTSIRARSSATTTPTAPSTTTATPT